MFKKNQRVVSRTEPDLGLGIVKSATEQGNIKVYFSRVNEDRAYSSLVESPIQRYKLRVGDRAAPIEGKHFVIEADEYDTAFFDKRSKFVHYRPRTAVLNNLEFDHADIFADLAQIQTQFHHLVRTVAGSGLVLHPTDCAALDEVLARGLWSREERFGVASQPAGGAQADWLLADSREHDGLNTFTVLQAGESVGDCRLALAGAHNRLNALAAIAAAHDAGVSAGRAIDALNRFAGVRRRLEIRGTVGEVTVIDDFAHHPTAIELTIAGLRDRVGKGRRIIAILEPRSNTMRLGAMKDQLVRSLAGADQVYCLDPGLDWPAAEVLAPLGKRCIVHHSVDDIVRSSVSSAQAGDQLLVMSNGGFGGIHQKLLDSLEQC